MISPERLDLMQAGWVRLLAPWGVSPADAYPVGRRRGTRWRARSRERREHLTSGDAVARSRHSRR